MASRALVMMGSEGEDVASFSTRAVMCSIAKDFLGSAKTRQAILMERPMSFWA